MPLRASHAPSCKQTLAAIRKFPITSFTLLLSLPMAVTTLLENPRTHMVPDDHMAMATRAASALTRLEMVVLIRSRLRYRQPHFCSGQPRMRPSSQTSSVRVDCAPSPTTVRPRPPGLSARSIDSCRRCVESNGLAQAQLGENTLAVNPTVRA